MRNLCREMSEENYNQSLRLNNDRFFFCGPFMILWTQEETVFRFIGCVLKIGCALKVSYKIVRRVYKKKEKEDDIHCL